LLILSRTISLGKFGSFNANLLIGRPFYLTYEIQDKQEGKSYSELRIVPASETHAEALLDNAATSAETRDEGDGEDDDEEEIVEENGEVKLKNNQHTVDDPSRQVLTSKDIEVMKQSATGSGLEIIQKIMSSHSSLDEKTAFSLAKYIVRKRKKFLRRFTALPLDVSMLASWMVNEKEPLRTMELREETLGLITCWANVHSSSMTGELDDIVGEPQGRWLVVDDTGGLVVAAMAEKMGILYPRDKEDEEAVFSNDDMEDVQVSEDITQEATPDHKAENSSSTTPYTRKPRPDDTHMTSTSNTLTILHPATQPNIAFLSYFSYDPSSAISSILSASHAHPLHTHLHSCSFLQLLDPSLDSAYAQPPPPVDPATLATWKTSKRSTYHRKRRRAERTKRIVDATRAGGFDGLVIASATEPLGILDATVPLLRGGAQVVVYSPNVEPLTQLMDAYSSARKAAFMAAIASAESATLESDEVPGAAEDITRRILADKDDFPVDPRLLLAPNLQTARAREWQVLPGRTHPLMTMKGGAEGYVFSATRVVPVEGRVEARGRFLKKRKIDVDGSVSVGGRRESGNGDGDTRKKSKVENDNEVEDVVDVGAQTGTAVDAVAA